MRAIAIVWGLFATLLLTVALLPFQLIGLIFGTDLAQKTPILWHKTMLKILGFQVEIQGKPMAEGPAILIANHISWTDICVFGAAGRLSFIAKSDVADWPFFGHLAKLQRVVFVERTRRSQSAAQADVIGERLSGGEVLVLFAEGTTGDGLNILPFKSTLVGAAHIAARKIEAGRVAIQPVTIAYTHRQGLKLGRTDMDSVAWVGDQGLVPHLIGILTGGPMRAVLYFSDPIWVDEKTDRKTIARQAEAEIRMRFVDALRS